MLTFELPNVTYEKDGVAQARMISREFTASFGEKSNLRKMLESWRGRTFTPDEVKAFDISKLAGAPCMLSVIHSTKGDKTFANINGIIQVPTGVTVPERVHPTIIYDIADLDKSEVFGQIPEWIQNKIKESEEFKNHGVSKAVDGAGTLAAQAEAAVAGIEDSSGLPF